MNIITVELPKVLSFADYHEVVEAVNLLRKFGLKKVQGREIDVEDYGHEFTGRYYGIFYIGKLPERRVIQVLLNKDIVKIQQ